MQLELNRIKKAPNKFEGNKTWWKIIPGHSFPPFFGKEIKMWKKGLAAFFVLIENWRKQKGSDRAKCKNASLQDRSQRDSQFWKTKGDWKLFRVLLLHICGHIWVIDSGIRKVVASAKKVQRFRCLFFLERVFDEWIWNNDAVKKWRKKSTSRGSSRPALSGRHD